MVKRFFCILLVISYLIAVSESPGQAGTAEKQGGEANLSGPKGSGTIELSYDDGVKAGMLSISGGGHCVKFTAPKEGKVLTAVKLYGSRYGEIEPPEEDFHIWLCDPNFEVINEFAFPYAFFKMRGISRWVTLKTEPTELPPEFIICVGFDPGKTKGVYVYYDANSSGHSFAGLPGGMLERFDKGDWMIRAIVGKQGQPASERKKPADEGPPLVVSTNPRALADNVEPSLAAITVTFNQTMMEGSYSWVGGGDTYPKTTGEPTYDQSKTVCSLPVSLEPGKVYWVRINSPNYRNFKNTRGISAKSYVILFSTKGADGNPTPIPEDLLAKAKAINEQNNHK